MPLPVRWIMAIAQLSALCCIMIIVVRCLWGFQEVPAAALEYESRS